MGMAASQARLLSITARMSNNENTSESIAYSKQRLADQTQQITNEYNEALDTTKLTVLTGFNGAEAVYEDISYNRMTGLQMAESTKQYVVTDTKGRILVTEQIADAYNYSKGDYNKFLAKLGYSQADINVQKTTGTSEQEKATAKLIHEAWDKYFQTVGITLGEPEHDTFLDEFQWNNTWSTVIDPTDNSIKYVNNEGKIITIPEDTDNIETYLKQKGVVSNIGDGYTAYKVDGTWKPINYEGTTKESKELYEYAMAITEAFLRTKSDTNNIPYDMENIKSANDASNNSALKYYRNIFDRIQQVGFITYTDVAAKTVNNDNYIYSESTRGTNKVSKNPLKDNYTFEAALRDGTLRLEYYSSTQKKFISTTISEDNCIQEVPDERAIAKAETKYTQDMADLENKDKKFDLELKKLDTEHKALETEYESVKSVVDKNVESSFKIFS